MSLDKSTEFIKLERTRAAFFWTHILRAPFWAIYNLLIFILYKDLHASAFQIALFIALRPVVSIFSVYWSSFINQRPDRLLSNIIWAGLLGYLPFLFFPLIYNVWYVLLASAFFMTMHRGVVPAWMEIFKQNLPGVSKQKVFSFGSIISYVVGAIAPLVIGPLLDRFELCWRWIFVSTALLGIGAIFFQLRIPIDFKKMNFSIPLSSPSEQIFAPWKSAWRLLFSRPDFRAYQIGFMVFGGSGLMLLQPVLPEFFIDVLGLSYTELSIALSLCKGIGFVLTSSIWARGMHHSDFFRFSSLITFLGAAFPLILIIAQLHHYWIYLAYLTYGIMQAGSELSWHLSGPIFAKDEESSRFSSLTILMVGVRGCAIPQLGWVLCLFIPSSSILIIGAMSCLIGCSWMLLYRRKAVEALF